MFALYLKARVVGVSIQIQLMNNGTNPVFVALAPMSYTDAISPPGQSQIQEMVDGRYKIAAGSAGASRVVISKTFDSKHVLGNEISSSPTAWMDLASASNTAPSDGEDPVICVLAGPTDGSTSSSYTYSIRIAYHVRYFDRKLQSLSLDHRILSGKFVPIHRNSTLLIDDNFYLTNHDDSVDSLESYMKMEKVEEDYNEVIQEKNGCPDQLSKRSVGPAKLVNSSMNSEGRSVSHVSRCTTSRKGAT